MKSRKRYRGTLYIELKEMVGNLAHSWLSSPQNLSGVGMSSIFLQYLIFVTFVIYDKLKGSFTKAS